jgi:hypothetical protein
MDDLSDDEFQRRYGPLAPLTLAEVASLFAGAPFLWWVVGGWSTELDASAPRRDHEDVDVAFLRRDLPLVQRWLGAYHLWDVHLGTLRLLAPDGEMAEEHEQLWLRRDAYSPWLLDLLLTPADGDGWIYKRDHRIRRPLTEVVRTRWDGLPVQPPEIALLFKARQRRAKDEADLAAVLPALGDPARTWLREALVLTEPGHPWLQQV